MLIDRQLMIEMTKRIGFTLIELIVVILILGILAAVAVPRIINLTSQARVASLMGLRASVISVSDLAHALQLTAGLGSNAAVTIEGVQVLMNRGYPNMNVGGIDLAVRFDSSTFRTVGGASMLFQVIGANDPTHCQLTTWSASFTAPPIFTTLTDGC